MRVEEIGFSEWEEALPDAGFNAFHTTEALRVLDRHSGAELRLFGAFKGEQSVGLFPLFVEEKSVARAILSPPLGFGIRKLGPVLMPTSPKRRKQEKVNREFIRGVLDAVEADAPRTLLYVSSGTRYSDPRPYQWAGFDVDPAFTYRIDLDSRTLEEIMSSFSKSLRREIRSGEDAALSIRLGGMAEAREVYRETRDRFREQELKFPLSWEFMRDLLIELDDRARVYFAETSGGEFCGGIVVLYSNDTAYFWKGGTRRTDLGTDVNGPLHWRIISDIVTDPPRQSIDQYDLYTANNEGIARYKSKFGGELVPYYRVESDSLPMTVAKKGYRVAALGEGLLSRD